MDHYFHRVAAATPTRFWINNVSRKEAETAISEGATGCTQNPSYTWKMICHEEEKEFVLKHLDEILASHPEMDNGEILAELQLTLVTNIAKTYFFPLYQASHGKNGYVSIQGDPFKEDTQSIVRYALKGHEAAPNIMAKVPATKEGLEAIEQLAAAGVPINATEIMSVQQAMDVGAAYRRGIRNLDNPAPIYYSHISGILDEYFQNSVKEKNVDISYDSLWQAGIACAKKCYACTKTKYPELGFIGGGARGLHHFTEMVGADACITINWKGTAENLINENPVVVSRFLQPCPDTVIDELLSKLPEFNTSYMLGAIQPDEYEDFGPVVLFRKSFENAWISAKNFISEYRSKL